MIGHFREPMDIASSSFSETTTIFGGESNLREALANVVRQYHPALIGIATTCLSETIGDDLNSCSADPGRSERPAGAGPVSTPSFRGTHRTVFNAAVCAVLDSLAQPRRRRAPAFVTCCRGSVSPATSGTCGRDRRGLSDSLHDSSRHSETARRARRARLRAIPPAGHAGRDGQMGGAEATIGVRATISLRRAGANAPRALRGAAPFQGFPIGHEESDRLFQAPILRSAMPEKHARNAPPRGLLH